MLDGRARVESELGMLAADRGEHAQAIKHLRRGLAMWRSVGDPGAKARCMLDMAKIYISQVELARAQPLVDEAVMLFKSTGDERGHVHGLNVLGGIHLLRDEVEEAVNTWQRASHLATISGDRGSYALVNLNLAEAYLELREFTASKECAVESLEAAAEVGHPQSEAYAHHRLACILREDAALDDALVHGQEAVRASRRLRMPVLEAMATRSTAEIRSQMLQRAAAKATEIDTHAVAGVDEMFREATAQARECGDQLVLLRALDAWSTFLHEQGFGQRGEKVRVEADRIAERIKSGVSRDASEDSGGLPSLEELVAERERIERSICREPLFD